MIKEAIILAGGFGTRLQSVVSDVPKPMAPINNIPFLDYQLNYLKHYNFEKVVLSVGYLADQIIEHYKNNFNGIVIEYAIEKEPLGTGGGIRLAMEKCTATNVLVLNGDSFFDVDLNKFFDQHNTWNSDCSLGLRKVSNTARYGTITLGAMTRITDFKEKNDIEREGIINAGVYLINRELFLANTKEGINFSIEKDFFETNINELNIFGFEQEAYFIDIGIPEDYKKAQHDFKEFKYR